MSRKPSLEVRLYERHGMAELVAMQRAILDDPASANPAHARGESIFLYTPKACARLDAIAWAITYKLADQKAAA